MSRPAADPASRICLTCRRVLDQLEQADGTHVWIHGFHLPADHEPVPVDPSELDHWDARCDFCYRPGIAWVVPARDFVLEGQPSGSKGDWGACEMCGQLVDRNQWTRLIDRVKLSWEERHGPMDPHVEASLRRIYRLLRQHMTGAPYRA